MINLLPPEFAMQIRYGRRNTAIRRWLAAVWLAIAGLIIILTGGWLYINNQTSRLQTETAASKQQLAVKNLEKVKKDAKEITGDVKVINQILSREIDFSGLMQDIGKVMPPGSVLGGLTLTKVDGVIDLTADARDYTTAAQIAVNIKDPKNNLFSSVDIVNINCSSADTTYKCNGVYKALFSKDAKTRFLSVAQDKKQ